MLKPRVIVGGVLILCSLAFAVNASELGGYVQARWEGWPDAYSTFRILRAYFGAKGDVTDWVSYCVLLTFADASVSLYDAYLDLKPLKYLSLRMGQFQTPIGMEKLVSSSAILFSDRSFASGFTQDRDIGLMLAARYKFIEAQAGIFNGEGRNKIDLKGSGKDVAMRLVLTPLDLLHVGGAYQMGTRVTSDTSGLNSTWNFNRWGVEFSLNPWDLWLASEFMGGKDDTIPRMTYYVEAAWMFRLNLSWLYGIQPAARYEYQDKNTNEKGLEETRVIGGVNIHFLPGHKVKLGLCYSREWLSDSDATDVIIAQLQVKF